MSAYKQIRSQTIDILSDVDEDNFDRAFDIIRPGTNPRLTPLEVYADEQRSVIQGTSDVGKKITEGELQKALSFCEGMYPGSDLSHLKHS